MHAKGGRVLAAALWVCVACAGSAESLAQHDAACRAALDRAYDGSTSGAIARLEERVAARPDDPLCAYVELLARAWELEQAPASDTRDRDFLRRAERVVALADARLARHAGDTRACLARGAAWGLQSRLHLRRVHQGDAARAAVKMRADLLRVPESDPLHAEALFGLGLYDYYADVLPRLLKLLRFLAHMPGGNRGRGLERIEAAERRAVLHHTEVQAQLFDIYAFYEGRHDDALAQMQALHRRYPGAPVWGLRLAEHQRERLGLYAESAATARALVEAAEQGRANFAPVVGLMARVALGEVLLADLRPGRARAAVLPAKDGAVEAAWIAPRARLVLGRSLEWEGDREGARVHYRLAAQSKERDWAERARKLLERPLPEPQVRAWSWLAEGRRAREGGHFAESFEAYRRALAAWPDCDEARLRVAEGDLAAGRADAARRALEELERRERVDPPWVGPWTRLLLARLHDLRGERGAALQLYNDVYQRSLGSAALKSLAAEGQERPWCPSPAHPPSPGPRNHSR